MKFASLAFVLLIGSMATLKTTLSEAQTIAVGHRNCFDRFVVGATYIIAATPLPPRIEPDLPIPRRSRALFTEARATVLEYATGPKYAEALITYLRLIAPGRFDHFDVDDVLGTEDSPLASAARELLANELERSGSAGWIKLIGLQWSQDPSSDQISVRFRTELQHESPYRVAGQSVLTAPIDRRVKHRQLYVALGNYTGGISEADTLPLLTRDGQSVSTQVHMRGDIDDHLWLSIRTDSGVLKTILIRHDGQFTGTETFDTIYTADAAD